MRDYLRKTWVKAGLALMALPTALAQASDGDAGHDAAVTGLTASLEESAAHPEGDGVALGAIRISF